MAKRLAERLEELREVLVERLALIEFGALCPEARAGFEVAKIRLEGPPSLMRFVAEVLAFAEHNGLGDLADTLLMLYGESMPFALSLQLGGIDQRCPWLFTMPLELSAMPHLRAALEQLDRTLALALDARGLQAGRSVVWQRWLSERMTLTEIYAQTFFGGPQPLVGTSSEVLKSWPPSTRSPSAPQLSTAC